MPQGNDFDSCGACGRTILRGERTVEYATPDGARVIVCALCKAAAEDAGWVPAALAGTLAGAGARRRRGLGLRQRLSRASRAARERPAGADAEGEAEGAGAAEPQEERAEPRKRGREAAAVKRHRPEPSKERPDRRPAGGGRSGSPQRKRAPKRRPSPEQVVRRGIEVYNGSPERRKVAGLIRSLGAPQVSVKPSPGGTVLVTIAWELSWYQWEIGKEDGEVAVRETSKGSEVSQLSLEDRAWNASVEDDGTIALGLAETEGEAEEGAEEPA